MLLLLIQVRCLRVLFGKGFRALEDGRSVMGLLGLAKVLNEGIDLLEGWVLLLRNQLQSVQTSSLGLVRVSA